MADDVEQMAEDHLCHAFCGVGRNVGHHDVLAAGHFEIYHVVAGGKHTDILQTWQHVEHGGIEDHLVGEHDFCSFASGYDVIGCGAFIDLHVGQF